MRQRLKDKTYLEMAQSMANLGTCCRLKVGCILLSEDGRIAGAGYNGAGPGMPHCTPETCGPHCRCLTTLHAEQNALFTCAIKPATAYVTHEPCHNCLKELATYGVRRVVFVKPYTSIAEDERAARQAWIDHYQIAWEQVDV